MAFAATPTISGSCLAGPSRFCRKNTDAFGNTLQSWDGGLWATPQAAAGWGHNTEETDGGTGLVYMYQRWYLPHTGTFASQAPYPPMMEHEYTFALGNPVIMVDPDGRFFSRVLPGPPGEWLDKRIGETTKLCRDWSTTAARKVFAAASLPANPP